MRRDAALAAVVVSLSAATGYAQAPDQQERCPLQAKRFFQEEFADETDDLARQLGPKRISSSYQSRYNTKSNRCFVLVEISSSTGGHISMSTHLVDANERRYYAYYVWIDDKNPAICELSPSFRDKKLCKTREEFDGFIAGYMEE